MLQRRLDVKELIGLLLKKSWIIILITCIFGGIGYWKAITLTTTYQSRVKVYIGDSENVMAGYMTDQAYSYYSFMTAFKEMIVIGDFLNETLKKHNLDLTAGQVSSQLTFTESDKYSPILGITYQSGNQKQAKKVLEVLTKEFEQQAQKIVPGVNVKVIDSVKVYPIHPNKKVVILTGALVGFVVSVGAILALDFLDDRIRNKEMVEKLLPVPVLGQLPHFSSKEEM